MGATVTPLASAATGGSALTFGKVLTRGLYAGLAAGVAAALVMLLVEKPIKAALAVEEARSAPVEHSGEHHEELFSRATQIVGGMLGVLVVAVSIAVILAIVYARVQHRLPAATDFGRATLLAATGYVAVALLPALKYPANPPGVGDPETVVSRTLLYLSFLGAGLVVAYLAYRARDWLVAKGWSGAHRSAAVAVGVVAAFALMFVVWPANSDPIPDDISAGLLWEFRLASLLLLTTLWGVLGLAFGLLLSRDK
jgi:hypothetical protein